MNQRAAYSIDTEVRFPPLEIIDVGRIAEQVDETWFNQTLCVVNDCVVRVGVVSGEFHWHRHEEEDEFFYVLDGTLAIDLADRSVALTTGQGFTVPRGVLHRTRAPQRTVMLMIEGRGVVPTGD